MQAFQIRCATQEALVKRLKAHLAVDGDQIKEYKDSIRLLNSEVKAKKEKLSELKGSTCRVEELTKANSNRMTELTAVYEHVDKAKANAVADFKYSQPYFNELRIPQDDDFEDFCKQVILLLPGLEFSQIYINTSVPTTPGEGDVIVEVEDEEREVDKPVEGETEEQTTTEGQTVPGAPFAQSICNLILLSLFCMFLYK